MPLPDLSLVTNTLIRLLERTIPFSPVWEGTPPTNLMIIGDPPDLLPQLNPENAMSVYLYHVEEDKNRKNRPAPRGNNPPVRFSEMALNLYYMLTAHGGTQGNSGAYEREQRLMGIALKAFHDYPILDARTRIGTGPDSFILPDFLRTERETFRLMLRPATLEDMNKLWTAASVPLRLATLYQVSVVLLEAERPTVQPVPVLFPQLVDFDRHLSEVRPFQPVWIRRTESDFIFVLPSETITRTVPGSPALVSVGESLRVIGFGFGGPSTQILLRKAEWSGPPDVDVSGWLTGTRTDTQFTIQVAGSVAGRTIIPGLYQIWIRNEAAMSNFYPVAVAPTIAPQDDPIPGLDPDHGAGGNPFRINGGPFENSGIESVEVFLGASILTQVAGVAVATGEFRVINGTQIEASVPDTLVAGHHPLRVVVNGISTPPIRWFQVMP